MKVVYNWLKDFVDVPATVQELAARLALHGTNVASVEAQPLGGVIDAEITSNRPDCLGVYGIAREVSAIYKLDFKNIAPKVTESATAKTNDAVSVKIEAPELCGRFTARVIRNVKIQPSPAWLRERLASCRCGVDKQRRGCDELRDAGAWACAARVRLRSGAQSFHRGAAVPNRRKKSRRSMASSAHSILRSA